MNTAEFKHFKLYSNNILKKMNKDELIDYIHILHHNWGCTDESYFNVVNRAKDLQNKLDNIQQKITDQIIIKNDEILKLRDEVLKLKGKKSKSAKEMFEDLGFTHEKLEFDDSIEYYKIYPKTNCQLTLCFDLEDKECFMEFDDEHKGVTMSLDAPEVKAIHQQIKELGWL